MLVLKVKEISKPSWRNYYFHEIEIVFLPLKIREIDKDQVTLWEKYLPQRFRLPMQYLKYANKFYKSIGNSQELIQEMEKGHVQEIHRPNDIKDIYM